MLCISILDGSLDGPALSGEAAVQAEIARRRTNLCLDHALERSLDGRDVGEQLQPFRVSRGHSVGFTQFAVTADRTPRMFANAVSSCGIGYPRPGLARTTRPLTYPRRSLPERGLGLSPPRSHPRFGPSCELIGVPTYETALRREPRESRRLSSAATGLKDRVVRVINRFASAYRRVAQGRIWSAVLLPAQKCAWGFYVRFARIDLVQIVTRYPLQSPNGIF